MKRLFPLCLLLLLVGCVHEHGYLGKLHPKYEYFATVPFQHDPGKIQNASSTIDKQSRCTAEVYVFVKDRYIKEMVMVLKERLPNNVEFTNISSGGPDHVSKIYSKADDIVNQELLKVANEKGYRMLPYYDFLVRFKDMNRNSIVQYGYAVDAAEINKGRERIELRSRLDKALAGAPPSSTVIPTAVKKSLPPRVTSKAGQGTLHK